MHESVKVHVFEHIIHPPLLLSGRCRRKDRQTVGKGIGMRDGRLVQVFEFRRLAAPTRRWLRWQGLRGRAFPVLGGVVKIFGNSLIEVLEESRPASGVSALHFGHLSDCVFDLHHEPFVLVLGGSELGRRGLEASVDFLGVGANFETEDFRKDGLLPLLLLFDIGVVDDRHGGGCWCGRRVRLRHIVILVVERIGESVLRGASDGPPRLPCEMGSEREREACQADRALLHASCYLVDDLHVVDAENADVA